MIYNNKNEFLQKMQDIIDAGEHVRIDEDALALFAKNLKPVEDQESLWNHSFARAGGDTLHDHLVRSFFVIAVNESQQSGCDYPDNEGQPARWEIDGSAAKAVNNKLNQMFEDGDLPTWDIQELEPVHLQAHMAGVPYAEERIKIFYEFCRPEAKTCIKGLVDKARQDEHRYRFDFNDVENLAKTFPTAFGSNEFRKKANLVPIVFASYASTKGVKVDLDVIAPTDHRLPQTFNGCGVLKFSNTILGKINNRIPFKQDEVLLQEIRASCILVFEKLKSMTDLPVNEIDGALWMAPKNGMMETMRRELGLLDLQCAECPLICYTMHF